MAFISDTFPLTLLYPILHSVSRWVRLVHGSPVLQPARPESCLRAPSRTWRCAAKGAEIAIPRVVASRCKYCTCAGHCSRGRCSHDCFSSRCFFRSGMRAHCVTCFCLLICCPLMVLFVSRTLRKLSVCSDRLSCGEAINHVVVS